MDNTAKELKINRFCQKFLPIDESRGFLFDIFGEKSKESIQFVTMTLPKSIGSSDVTFKSIELECRHGDKTTYAVKVGDDEHQRIKASDVQDLLSRAIKFNGERVESTNDLKEAISNATENSIEDKYRGFYTATFNIEDLSKIASSMNPEQKVVSTIEIPKQTEPSKKFKNV